jgi:hypothetical protein
MKTVFQQIPHNLDTGDNQNRAKVGQYALSAADV